MDFRDLDYDQRSPHFFQLIAENDVDQVLAVIDEIEDEWHWYKTEDNEDALDYALRLSQLEVAWWFVPHMPYQLIYEESSLHTDSNDILADIALVMGRTAFFMSHANLMINPMHRINIWLRGPYSLDGCGCFDNHESRYPMVSVLIHAYTSCLTDVDTYQCFVRNVISMINSRNEISSYEQKFIIQRLLDLVKYAKLMDVWFSDCWRLVVPYL